MSKLVWASYHFGLALEEELFFLIYHMRQQMSEIISLPPYRRKWYIDKYIDQRSKEQEYLEKQRKKK